MSFSACNADVSAFIGQPINRSVTKVCKYHGAVKCRNSAQVAKQYSNIYLLFYELQTCSFLIYDICQEKIACLHDLSEIKTT